jgi:antitoxin component of MazEF toxin-antitoxin module
MNVFDEKLRRVGSSFGVLVPNRTVKENGLKMGERVKIAILRKNTALIDSAFGSAKGASFERERKDRAV